MEQKLEHMNQNKTWRERSWRSTATNNWLPEGQTRLRSLSTSPLRSGRLQKSFHPTITSLKNLRNQEILGLLEEIGGYGHGDFMLLLIPCRCPPFQFDPQTLNVALLLVDHAPGSSGAAPAPASTVRNKRFSWSAAKQQFLNHQQVSRIIKLSKYSKLIQPIIEIIKHQLQPSRIHLTSHGWNPCQAGSSPSMTFSRFLSCPGKLGRHFQGTGDHQSNHTPIWWWFIPLIPAIKLVKKLGMVGQIALLTFSTFVKPGMNLDEPPISAAWDAPSAFGA